MGARIRELVAARDGHCRYAWDVPPTQRSRCQGESQWCHFGAFKRFKTRGQSPETRHTTAGSLMLCEKHHDEYDERRLEIVIAGGDGCDGTLAYFPGWKFGEREAPC